MCAGVRFRANACPQLLRGWDTHFTVTLLVWALLIAAGVYANDAWNRLDDATRSSIESSVGLSSAALCAVVATVLVCAGCCFGGRIRHPLHTTPRPRSLDKYTAVGLGATTGAKPEDLYLDMMKRTLVNVIYEDKPQWLYDDRKQPFLSDAGFDLEYRVRGEDVPRQAHTMTGLVRLNNVQELVNVRPA